MEIERPCDVDGRGHAVIKGPNAEGRAIARLGRAGREQGRQLIFLDWKEGYPGRPLSQSPSPPRPPGTLVLATQPRAQSTAADAGIHCQ